MQVMKTSQSVLEEEHRDTLTVTSNLASTYLNQGRWTEAEELNAQVMKTSKRALVEEHPSTLISMFNLSHTLKEQNHSKKALQLMSDTVRLSEKVIGTGHPKTIAWKETLKLWLDDRYLYTSLFRHCANGNNILLSERIYKRT